MYASLPQKRTRRFIKYDTFMTELKARGLIAQVTDEEEIKELINNGKADVLYRV